MPIYEFKCKSCGKQFQKLVGVVASDTDTLACSNCGSTDLTRLVSRFRSIRTEEQALDQLAEFGSEEDLENPSKLGSWIREVGKTLDDDPGDLEELFETSMEDDRQDGSD